MFKLLNEYKFKILNIETYEIHGPYTFEEFYSSNLRNFLDDYGVSEEYIILPQLNITDRNGGEIYLGDILKLEDDMFAIALELSLKLNNDRIIGYSTYLSRGVVVADASYKVSDRLTGKGE